MKSKQNNVASLKAYKGVHQRLMRKPRYTAFRKQKLEFFLYESQSTETFRSHFGSVGSAKWIEYFIKFLNAPKVDEEIVWVWLQKFLKLKALDSSTLEVNFAAGRDSNNNEYPTKWYTALRKLNPKRPSHSQDDFSTGSSMLKRANTKNNSGEDNAVRYEAALEKFHIEQPSKLDSFSKNQVFRTLSMMEEPWVSDHESNFHETTNMNTNHAEANILLNTNGTVNQHPQTVYPSIGEDSGIIDYSVSNKKNNSSEEKMHFLADGLSSVSQNNFSTTDYGFKGYGAWKKSQVPEQNVVEPNSFQPIDRLADNSKENVLQQMMLTSYESDLNPGVSLQPEYNLLQTFSNPHSNLTRSNNLVSNVAAQRKSKPSYEEGKNSHIMEIAGTVADIAVNGHNAGPGISKFAASVDGGTKRAIEVKKDQTPGGSSNLDVDDIEAEEEKCVDFAVNLVKNVNDSKRGECKIYIDILKSICMGKIKFIRVITELENCINSMY